ncbi:hypothetical protein M422DRAFT_246631 [Sphaerobolus stellatus SS14]|nr:hypothetical protein M422DRAFT_246631 [Sphaerobolus stellatus SS14]
MSSVSRVHSDHLALSKFSTCELSDALIKLGLPHGGHIPDISMLSSSDQETRICGPAYTVKMVLASDTEAPKLEKHFVDEATPNSVIVIDAPPQTKSAVWGGLMSAGAVSRACLGVVISGRARDISEHLEINFPVFARSHSTLGQSPFTRPSEINVPLVIRPQPFDSDFPAVSLEPGDLIVADRDGVVCVPKDLEEKTIELATRGREIDAKCMEDIKAGKGVKESFKKWRSK